MTWSSFPALSASYSQLSALGLKTVLDWSQVDEAQTAEILERKLKVRPGSLLYIQSTIALKKMPKLCSKYKCFNRDTVWKERSEEVRMSAH